MSRPVLVPIKQVGEDQLSQFFGDVEPWSAAYARSSTFGYVAMIEDGALVVRAGRLLLNAATPKNDSRPLRSKSIAAGCIDLASLGLEPQEFLLRLTKEGVETEDGRLCLPPENDSYSSYYVRAEQERDGPAEYRISTVTLSGRRQADNVPAHLLDWELRAATPPFDSVQELATHFGAGAVRHDVCLVEIIAMPVVRVDETSSINAGVARIRLRLPSALPREGLSLGYRVLSLGKVERRGVADANAFAWTADDGEMIATIDLQVGPRVGIHCFARFAGTCHHQKRVYDPINTPNMVRQVYGLFDPGLKHLGAFLRQDGKADQDDFEAGVSFLLSMHGFQVVLLGGTPKTKDAPDLVAWTPTGDLLVVECTTGLLKVQDKLAKLAERTSRVRSQLGAFERPVERVLPLEVTALARSGVVAEREAAIEQGIAVLVQEDLVQLLTMTSQHPDAQTMFNRFWEQVNRPPTVWPPGG